MGEGSIDAEIRMFSSRSALPCCVRAGCYIGRPKCWQLRLKIKHARKQMKIHALVLPVASPFMPHVKQQMARVIIIIICDGNVWREREREIEEERRSGVEMPQGWKSLAKHFFTLPAQFPWNAHNRILFIIFLLKTQTRMWSCGRMCAWGFFSLFLLFFFFFFSICPAHSPALLDRRASSIIINSNQRCSHTAGNGSSVLWRQRDCGVAAPIAPSAITLNGERKRDSEELEWRRTQ